MPVIKTITDQRTVERYGGEKMLVASAIAYDELVRQVPAGMVTTTGDLRTLLAQKAGADFTNPLTAGIFVSLVAQASEQRPDDPTPYWRALKTDGELNPKFPGGIEAQSDKLSKEGHTIVQRGKRFFVDAYETKRYQFP